MRGDMGTENVRVAAMQKFLRRSDGLDIENDRTFIYGKSTLNTRIESWWGILRKECCQIWMEELKVLRDSGFFSGNALDINLVQFCLMRLLQKRWISANVIWRLHIDFTFRFSSKL
ncbi:hypothetical protein ACJMK2_043739 [Sinanodonta woodiana]|uniref:Integrase core domain-containing protein n=1 Tax=Sinanodonta woodiana TaxID=1069815 RepID=A0ABD3W130_SINWO